MTPISRDTERNGIQSSMEKGPRKVNKDNSYYIHANVELTSYKDLAKKHGKTT